MLTTNVNYPHLVIFAHWERRRELGTVSVGAIWKYGRYEFLHIMLVAVELQGCVLGAM